MSAWGPAAEKQLDLTDVRGALHAAAQGPRPLRRVWRGLRDRRVSALGRTHVTQSVLLPRGVGLEGRLQKLADTWEFWSTSTGKTARRSRDYEEDEKPLRDERE